MNVVIFGLGEIASLAWHAFTHDSAHRVVAFTVDRRYIVEKELHGCPVLPFDSLKASLPQDGFGIYVALGWKRMNALRAEVLERARAMHYPVLSHISSRANVWSDLVFGENCLIHQGVSVGPFTHIEDNCLIFGGANIGHHARIQANCYVAGRAMVSGGVVVGRGSVLGANCTITDGVRIAPSTFIGAGTVITFDTLPNRVYTAPGARLRKVLADRMPRTR